MKKEDTSGGIIRLDFSGLDSISFFDTLDESIVVVNEEGTFVFLNHAAKALFCDISDVMVGKKFSDFVDKESEFSYLLEEVLEKGWMNDEVHGFRPDGSEFWYVYSAIVLGQKELGNRYIAASVRDVTKKRLSERDSVLILHDHEDIIQKSSDPIFLLDLDGKIVYVNEAAVSLLGYSHSELVGISIWDLAVPDELEQSKSRFKKLINGHQFSYYSRSAICKDGTRVQLELSSTLLRNEENDPIFLQCTCRDRTRERRERRRLERERMAYQIIAKSTTLTDDVNSMCQLVLSGLMRVLEFEIGTIRLLDEQTKQLEMVASVGMCKEEKSSWGLPLSLDSKSSLAAHIWRTKRPVFAPNLDEYEDFEKIGQYFSKVNIRSHIGWPICDENGGVIGVINIGSYEPKSINHIEYDFFKIISDLLGLAINQKSAERSLEESLTLFRATVDSVFDGILAVSKDDRVIHTNKKFAEMWGIPENVVKESDAEKLREYVLDQLEDPKGFIERLSEIYETDDEQVDLIRFKDGRVFRRHSCPLMFNNQNIGRVWSFRDITTEYSLNLVQSARNELSLQIGSESSIENVLKSYTETVLKIAKLDYGGFYFVDRDIGGLTLVYQVGLSSEFLYSVTYLGPNKKQTQIALEGEIVYTRVRDLGTQPEDVIEREKLGAIAILPFKHHDSVIGCLIVGSHTLSEIPKAIRPALKSLNENVGEILASVRAEQALHDNEVRYRSILHSVSDFILVLDKNLRIVDFYGPKNNATSDLVFQSLGHRIEQTCKREVVESVLQIRDLLQDDKDVNSFELDFDVYDETRRFSLGANYHADGESIVIVARDITEKRNMEEERSQQQRELELYATLLRHDIGNDLQDLHWYLEALRQSNPETESWSDWMESSEATLERIGRLLDVFSVIHEPVSGTIVDLVKEVADEAAETYRNLNISVEVKGRMQGLRTPCGRLFPMCMENLIRNSVQHGGDNSKVVITVTRKKEFVYIDVYDNGPGLPPHVIENLFERGVSTKLSKSKSGLGLYLTKQILMSYGCEIELVSSESTSGTIFRISVPILP